MDLKRLLCNLKVVDVEEVLHVSFSLAVDHKERYSVVSVYQKTDPLSNQQSSDHSAS